MTTTTHLYQTGSKIQRIQKKSDILEKDIQTIIENDMETYLGIRFIATEYTTSKEHGGRIDTLGIDENNCPVIIEYKRSVDRSAAIQGLFYLSWLEDHKSEFELNVMKKYGEKTSQNINWTNPRVICIANDFHKYIIGAVNHMGSNIELMQYQLFDNNMLMITDIYTKNQKRNTTLMKTNTPYSSPTSERLDRCDPTIRDIFENLKVFLLDLDDTVKIVETKNYTAFKTNRNFAVVKIFSQKGVIRIGVNVNPDSIDLENGFTEDARDIHGNDGPLHITIKKFDDLEKAKSLLVKSFDNS